jgi:hypothetical protein
MEITELGRAGEKQQLFSCSMTQTLNHEAILLLRESKIRLLEVSLTLTGQFLSQAIVAKILLWIPKRKTGIKLTD